MSFHKKLGSFLLGLALAAGFGVWAQVPVSTLPQATLPLTGNESVVMNQNGTTKQGPVSAITGSTTLTQGPGIILSPNPIHGTGTISVAMPGANTQVLYNSSGTFGASANFTFNQATNFLGLNGYQSWVDQTAPATPGSGVTLYSSPFLTSGISQPTYKDDFGGVVSLGIEQHMIVYNTSGGTINPGVVVYINGSHAQVPTVGLAQANSASTLPAVGFTQYSIPNNAYGEIHVSGLVGATTTGTSVGNTLYVSPTTPGAFTNVAPTGAGQFAQSIGIVTNVAGAGAGNVQLLFKTPLSATTVTGAAGATGNVQYNNAGAFAGTNDFNWDSTNYILTMGNAALGGPTITTPATSTIGGGNQVILQGGFATTNSPGGNARVVGGSGTNAVGGSAQLAGGAGTGTNSGGSASVQGGTAANATGGGVTISTLSGGTAGNASGTIAIQTGLPNAGGNTGILALSTGSTTSGTAGNITITTGASNAGGTSGSVTITAGHNVGGTDGGINLVAHGATVETIGAGLQIGAPTGGDKGAGSINMQSCFVNNVACVTSPASPSTSIQFNNGGVFGGTADFTFNSGTDTLSLGTAATTGTIQPQTSATTGATLRVVGGAGGATNAGGVLQLVGGPGGATSGNGGSATLSGGSASGSGNGGLAQIIGGNSGVTGAGGSVSISAGTAGSAAGGNITLTASPNGGSGANGNVTINSPGGTFVTAATGATTLTVTGPSTANSAMTVASGATSGSAFGLLVQGGTTTADYALNVTNHAGSGLFQVDGAGFIKVASDFLAFGTMVTSGASCNPSVSSDLINITGCTRNSTGNYTVNFSRTTGTSYTCTVTPDNSAGFSFLTARSTTSVTVQTNNTSNVAADISFDMICW